MPTLTRPALVRLTIILGTLSAFGPLSIDMYLPGLPAIGREFGVETAAAQQSLSAFFIGLALGQAFYGPIADRVGRRMPLLFGCILYTIASLGCVFAPTIGSLIGLRFAQALGGCAGMVIARSVVRDLFDARESARIYSFLMLVMGLAPITAPLIGGQLLIFFGWRAIFVVLAAFGLLCVALVLFGLPETLPPERRSTAGLGHALAAYGSLIRDRQFVGFALAGGFISAGMFVYIAGSPFVLIELYGVAPEHYGWIFGANALGLIAASQLNRRLLQRYNGETIMRAAIGTIVISGVVLVAVAVTGLGGLAGLLPPLFVCIAGYGLVAPNATAAAMAPYGAMAGSASALLGTLQFSVGAMAGILVGVLHNGTALPMAGMIAACAIAALLAFQTMAMRPVAQPLAR
jgi:DHA1 family bicyclomycin/chloramphenicol resistance-like MFS transporter